MWMSSLEEYLLLLNTHVRGAYVMAKSTVATSSKQKSEWKKSGSQMEVAHGECWWNQLLQAHHARKSWKEVNMTKILGVVLLAVLV